jgi:hypothetical protein
MHICSCVNQKFTLQRGITAEKTGLTGYMACTHDALVK